MTGIMPVLRVGILGLSHDHVWGNLAALAAGGLGRVVAAAEPDARLRERLRALDGGAPSSSLPTTARPPRSASARSSGGSPSCSRNRWPPTSRARTRCSPPRAAPACR